MGEGGEGDDAVVRLLKAQAARMEAQTRRLERMTENVLLLKEEIKLLRMAVVERGIEIVADLAQLRDDVHREA